MKIKLLILSSFISLLSCNSRKSTEKANDANYIETLNNKEADSQNKTQANLGNLISTIEFGIKATGDELKDFQDGVIPWISLENPQSEIDKLIDADKIVIPYSEVTLIIDYPLNNPESFVLKSDANGFTKKQLILEISKKYHEIYKTEETTAKTKTIPIDKREGLINRNETDGKYGIWGHDIGDLDLSSIEVYKSENGKIQILLGVES
jgi:predicted P-loop ATPase/GTPase